MFALKRELKLNKVETSQMRSLAGFKRFVYNYGALINSSLVGTRLISRHLIQPELMPSKKYLLPSRCKDLNTPG